MYTIVQVITNTSTTLPSTEGMVSMALIMGAVMVLAGLAGATYAAARSMVNTWESLSGIDSDLNMVYPDASEMAAWSEDPEIQFFGEALPAEGDDLVLSSRVQWVNNDPHAPNFPYRKEAVKYIMALHGVSEATAENILFNMDCGVSQPTDKTVVFGHERRVVGFLPAPEVELPRAKVNSAGRAYDPVTGRFIAKADIHNWVLS